MHKLIFGDFQLQKQSNFNSQIGARYTIIIQKSQTIRHDKSCCPAPILTPSEDIPKSAKAVVPLKKNKVKNAQVDFQRLSAAKAKQL